MALKIDEETALLCDFLFTTELTIPLNPVRLIARPLKMYIFVYTTSSYNLKHEGKE